MSNTERPILKCKNGVFVGYEKDGVHIFKGIPYAKPPAGDLRWRPPQRELTAFAYKYMPL